MPTIALTYTEGGVDYTRTFYRVLSVKGFKPGDHHVVFPSLRQQFLDGRVRKKQAGFSRVFTVDFGAVTDADDLAFIGKFVNAETQYVDEYTYDSTTESDLRVVDLNGEEFASDWRDGVEIGRMVVLEMQEAAIRQDYPTGSPAASMPTTQIYFKKRVQITGTPSSPQTLTFGSGVLAATEGSGSFPTVTGGSQVYTVAINSGPYQEAQCFLASTPSIGGGGYVTFTAAHSEAGGAASDGNHYADITLTVQNV